LEWLDVLWLAKGRRMTRRDPASPTLTRKRRCAVYTRKSTDEGLEKEFNSLDAQRESCEAYIASQRSEGWVLVHDRYDDGGVSGGTLERPALRRLLADIEAGLVDVVVVYKIDRLSRSLMDFAKLVQIFDQNEVTFVSVTQSFNTTTSMGRLTLNILLSFAQFEREVIGERVRDKIAASRARGMWMGGPVPLGYRVENRKLLVDEAAAATVRRVFEGFAEIGSATRLLPILRAEGLLTKHGRPFDKGAVYKLLVNRVYLGEAVHKGKSYPGEHAAIIPLTLWNKVHEIMASNPHMRAGLARNRSPALLRGLIFGADGRALSPTHTRKQGRLYRYYVSQSVLKGGADDAPYRRLPAGEIEALVLDQLRALLRQPEVVVGTWRAAREEEADITEEDTRLALERLDEMWGELFPSEQARIFGLMVDRVEVGTDGADVRLRLEGLGSLAREFRPRRAAEIGKAA
jgi:DNA invertase Pin-like site-specific DNA recombinase